MTIMFDVVEMYPSISSNLCSAVLYFAAYYLYIASKDCHIIIGTKNSIPVYNDTVWNKKSTSALFDIFLGSYVGVEVEPCDLVGFVLFYLIRTKHDTNFCLYRDVGLGTVKGSPGQIENIKRYLCEIFKQHNLKRTAEANMKTVEFLDVKTQPHKWCVYAIQQT